MRSLPQRTPTEGRFQIGPVHRLHSYHGLLPAKEPPCLATTRASGKRASLESSGERMVMGGGGGWTHDADGLDAHLQQQIRAALEHREPLEPPPLPRLEEHEVQIHGALANHFEAELAAASDDLAVHERA